MKLSNIVLINIFSISYFSQVTHGNLNFTIGYVQYKGDAIDQVLVIGATAGAILAIMIILLITLIYYRKATENERLVKQMEQQRDALELRVAQECKEGKWIKTSTLYWWLSICKQVAKNTLYIDTELLLTGHTFLFVK